MASEKKPNPRLQLLLHCPFDLDHLVRLGVYQQHLEECRQLHAKKDANQCSPPAVEVQTVPPTKRPDQAPKAPSRASMSGGKKGRAVAVRAVPARAVPPPTRASTAKEQPRELDSGED
ncbi:uncharacterized protein LOC144144784 [Haemaphysalis longicornis]